ncbi:MAG TPA: hypothetical protein DIT39_04420 [Tissierellales bacterium]|nr:hypothetical protein [Tissierellales bacterium]
MHEGGDNHPGIRRIIDLCHCLPGTAERYPPLGKSVPANGDYTIYSFLHPLQPSALKDLPEERVLRYDHGILQLCGFDIVHERPLGFMSGDFHEGRTGSLERKAFVAKDLRAVWVLTSSYFGFLWVMMSPRALEFISTMPSI